MGAVIGLSVFVATQPNESPPPPPQVVVVQVTSLYPTKLPTIRPTRTPTNHPTTQQPHHTPTSSPTTDPPANLVLEEGGESQVGDSGLGVGLGVALPLLFIVATVLGGVMFVRRRRGSSSSLPQTRAVLYTVTKRSTRETQVCGSEDELAEVIGATEAVKYLRYGGQPMGDQGDIHVQTEYIHI